MRSIGRATFANGIGSALAGFLGSTGVNTSSANSGLSGATGVTSRRIAYATGGIFLVLAFTPKIAGLLAVMPRPVMGAALMFVAAFTFVKGLQIIASRLLDARRTFVIGLSFIIAIAVDISPAFFRALPASVQPLVGSSLVAGMLIAIRLNLSSASVRARSRTSCCHCRHADLLAQHALGKTDEMRASLAAALGGIFLMAVPASVGLTSCANR